MKTINLPTASDSCIDLAAIDNCTKGVIITYKDTSCVGFIYFDTEYWYYSNSIDVQETIINDSNLLNMITSLIKNKVANTFKLLEFV